MKKQKPDRIGKKKYIERLSFIPGNGNNDKNVGRSTIKGQGSYDSRKRPDQERE